MFASNGTIQASFGLGAITQQAGLMDSSDMGGQKLTRATSTLFAFRRDLDTVGYCSPRFQTRILQFAPPGR